MDTCVVANHWERWLGDPQVGALTLGLACRLLDLRLCQLVAELWFDLAANLLATNDRGAAMRRYPSVKRWAEETCTRFNWQHLARTDDGLCFALALRLSRDLYRVALRVGPGRDLPGWFSHLLRRLLERRLPAPVLRELKKLRCAGPDLRFSSYVNPERVDEVTRISVQRLPEIVLVGDKMRARPHYFRADPVGVARLDPEGFRVAQYTQEAGGEGLLKGPACDTIDVDNANFPFWPHAAARAVDGFSHRCAVHAAGDGLEWSDWPQMTLSASDVRRSTWRFWTGVFRRSELGDVNRFDLVGRTAWEIDWRLNSEHPAV